MSNLPLTALVATIIACAGAAHASPVTFKFNNFGKSSRVDVFAGDSNVNNLSVGTINITPLFRDGIPLDSGQVVAFCTEIQESISSGRTYSNYTVVSADQASAGTAGPPGSGSGIPSGGIGEAAARNAAILYDLYYAGTSSSDWTRNTAGAFQLALWELTHDNDGSLYDTDGFFYSRDGRTTKFDLAQSYVDAVLATDANYNPFTELVALSSVGDPGNQDILVHAQFVGGVPGQEIPFGVNPFPALAICGFFAWRRLKKRAAERTVEANTTA